MRKYSALILVLFLFVCFSSVARADAQFKINSATIARTNNDGDWALIEVRATVQNIGDKAGTAKMIIEPNFSLSAPTFMGGKLEEYAYIRRGSTQTFSCLGLIRVKYTPNAMYHYTAKVYYAAGSAAETLDTKDVSIKEAMLTLRAMPASPVTR